MGRKPNTAVRRRQITEALLEEMSTNGFERASVKSIAARAGLAPGLVHYHFESKEEILLALLDELIEEGERRFAAAMESADSPTGRLAAFVSSRVGLGPQSDGTQVKAWVAIIAEAMGQAAVRARVAEWLARDHARLSRLFAAATGGASKEQAALLLAMVLGSFSLHAVNVAGIPKGYAERQIQLWLRAALENH